MLRVELVSQNWLRTVWKLGQSEEKRTKGKKIISLDINPPFTPTEEHRSVCFLSTIQSLFRGLDKSCQVWNSSYWVSADCPTSLLFLMMRMRPLSEHTHHETNNSRFNTKLWLILFEGNTKSAVHDVAVFPGYQHVKKLSRFRPFTIPSDLADRITWVNLVTSHDFKEDSSLFT